MRKRCSRSWISKVVSWNVYCLNRSNRTFVCRSNTFLKRSHFSSKCWLIPNGRRHTSQKCRNFRSSLCKTEDIINKKQQVASFFITKIFSHSKSGEGHASTSSWWFIHLSKHERCFRKYSRFFHFAVEVISFTSTFSYSRKHRIATMFLGNITNKLLNHHSFSYSGSTKEPYFSTLQKWAEKINNFDTSFQNFSFLRLTFEVRCMTVNRIQFWIFWIWFSINCFTNYVKHASKCHFSNWN